MSLLRIPTTAAGTVPLVQIQRDCSAAFKILDSAEMDTTVQVWEFFKVWLLSRFRKYNIHDLTFLSTKILRVLFLFFFFLPRALLDNPNYDLHFLFIYLFIYLFFGLIKLSLLQLLHCMLKPLFLRALGTISWFHCRHRWMRYKYPQLQYEQLRLLQILRDRSIALVVLEIQICRHIIRYTSGLPEILDTGLTGATASFAHLPQPLFPFNPVTHYHDHGTFCRLLFRHRWMYWRYPQL